MCRNTQWIAIVAASLLLTAFAGCDESRGKDAEVRTEVRPQPVAAEAASRFKETEPSGKTAVESAIELSREHAKLSEEMVALRDQKRLLETENATLKQQLTETDAQLTQTRKELNEANDLLIEMRGELNNWKNDVIGFRDEMRDAERAQLEALLKILTILGGEVRAQTAQASDANEPSRPGGPTQP